MTMIHDKPMLNHAIIGCGRIAPNHVLAARANGMVVSWCCDRDFEKAKRFADKYGIDFCTDSYSSLIHNKDIDSVSVCTDHASHVPIASDFMGMKHILIEKPLSIDLKTARSFMEKMDGCSKAISVVSQHRFDKIVRLVKKMIEKHEFGEITMVNVELSCYRSRKYYLDSCWRGKRALEGGSAVINQAYHLVDLLIFLFGAPKQVSSYCKNLIFNDINDTEDTCVAIMDYGSHVCTFSTTNTSTQPWLTRIKITGTKGHVEFDIDFPARIHDIDIKSDSYNDELSSIETQFQIDSGKNINYYGLSHIAQFEDFRSSMINHHSPAVTVFDALSTLSLISEMYQSRS